MSKNFNTNTDNHDEWLTPKYITDFFEFDLDPCSPIQRPWDTAKNHYNKIDDGFSKEWEGFVFCNPPYGRETYRWLDKCAEHGNAIGLTFARTETIGFHNTVWDKADALFFFKGRLAFHYVDGRKGSSANAPSVLIAYGENALNKLKKFSNLYSGAFIKLVKN